MKQHSTHDRQAGGDGDGFVRLVRGGWSGYVAASVMILGLLMNAPTARADNADRAAATADREDDAARHELRRAAVELTNYDFTNAYRAYRALLVRLPPDDPAAEEALFGAAVSAQQITPAEPGLIEESRHLFETLVARTPPSRFAPRAMMNLGRLCELRDYQADPVDLQGARSCYEQVIERWPDDPIADEAVWRLAGTYIQCHEDRASIERGVGMLEQWLDQRPDNGLAAGMWEYLGATYLSYLDQPRLALRCYLQADEIGLINTTTAGKLYWKMAQLARQGDDLDTAIVYYQKIIVQTPQSGRAYEAQQALQRLSNTYPERDIRIPPIQTFRVHEMDEPAPDPSTVESQPLPGQVDP